MADVVVRNPVGTIQGIFFPHIEPFNPPCSHGETLGITNIAVFFITESRRTYAQYIDYFFDKGVIITYLQKYRFLVEIKGVLCPEIDVPSLEIVPFVCF